MRNEPLEATIDELRKAGYSPTWQQGRKHFKVRAAGLPAIAVGCSSSDCNAAKQARRTVRRIIAQNRR